MNSPCFLFALLILLVGDQTCQAMYLRPQQVRAEMLEIAAKAVTNIKKSGVPEIETSDHTAAPQQEVNLILPYSYDIDSNANGVFDEEDQNQLKIFLTALEDLARKNGRQRFG